MAAERTGLWGSEDAYERYMGRWSRRIAPLFLDWLSVPPQADWVDVGCGTGVLSSAILAKCTPRSVAGVDPAAPFLQAAQARVTDRRFGCRQASAEALPFADGAFAAAVSGLVLNFVADKKKAVSEMKRVVAPGGSVASYVWDYAGHMQIMRHFFAAASALDERAKAFDDGLNAPVCRPGPLLDLLREAGLAEVEVQAFDVPAAFDSFEDYWTPFLGGTGSAPKYCASLAPGALERLRVSLRSRLPTGPDGEILLAIRAWGVKARTPL